MAQIIDAGATVADHIVACGSVAVTILPAERVHFCESGDAERIADFVNPATVRPEAHMRMVVRECAHGARTRTHTCPACGGQRVFGGRAW